MQLQESNNLREIDQERLLDFLLHFSTIQTSVGVQTSRIVLNTSRIAEAYGYETTMMLFQRNVAITLAEGSAHSPNGTTRHSKRHVTTALTHHRSLPLNFLLNAELSRLSWWAYDNKPTMDELEERLEMVINAPRVNRWLILFLISIANSAFCLLFEGDIMATIMVFFGTGVGFFARQELNLRHAYHYFTVLVAAFLSSISVGLLLLTELSNTPQVALTTSVLFLIPGVPIINGMIDFFDGYILNGMSRLINALLIIFSISVGISGALMILGVDINY